MLPAGEHEVELAVLTLEAASLLDDKLLLDNELILDDELLLDESESLSSLPPQPTNITKMVTSIKFALVKIDLLNKSFTRQNI